MRPLKLHELVEQWLESHKTLWHFFVSQREGRYTYQVNCLCQTNGWWLAVDNDFVYLGTEACDLNNIPKLFVSDPEFFPKIEDTLIKGHLKWKGEFRGRPAQP